MAIMFGGSAIASIGQTISQSLSQRALADAQKTSFETNKRIAELQATDAIKRGDREATLFAKKVKRVIGTQRAGLAAQGVEVDTGTALDLQLDTAEVGAIDTETIRHNAFREAWGYRVQAEDYGARGAYASMAGKAEARNTLITGGLNTLNLGLNYYKTTTLEDYLK
jgi:hypothetical protein